MTNRPTEDIDQLVERAQRAGFTEVFVEADVVQNGGVPDFLIMSPTIANRFHELHPEATRLSLDQLRARITKLESERTDDFQQQQQ